MRRVTKWKTLIIIGSSLLFVFSVVPHFVDVRTLGFVFAIPSLILYGGYFALGMGIVGLIQERRKKRKYKKSTE